MNASAFHSPPREARFRLAELREGALMEAEGDIFRAVSP
jgi:hypothetical protein